MTNRYEPTNKELLKVITNHKGKVMVTIQGTELYVIVEKQDLKRTIKELIEQGTEYSFEYFMNNEGSYIFLDAIPY